MSQPPGEQPQQQPWSPPQQPFGTPPPPPVPPTAPPQTGYGQPQVPHPGMPVAGNPYAQPGPPYGVYPSPHGPLPGALGQAPGPRKRQTGLIVTAAVVALVMVAGGVWFAVGRGGDDTESPKAKASPSTSAPSVSPTDKSPIVQPPPEESESPDNPLVPEPTGTGLQAVWKASDSTMLAIGDAYLDEPARINAILSDGSGFECKGRWQEDESGDFLEVALLCEQDGVRVADKDRAGNLSQNGDTLTVKWNKGATGSESFERFRDMDPA
ncbi:hypothetical protein [Streptomyces sp. NPDC087538]|uniref:hypothetical protein n=1 Tax=Streptomyces sp. NPDC087538 TaxID=3365797 RepID=UPI0038234D8B